MMTYSIARYSECVPVRMIGCFEHLNAPVIIFEMQTPHELQRKQSFTFCILIDPNNSTAFATYIQHQWIPQKNCTDWTIVITHLESLRVSCMCLLCALGEFGELRYCLANFLRCYFKYIISANCYAQISQLIEWNSTRTGLPLAMCRRARVLRNSACDETIRISVYGFPVPIF